jgi:hypothetical protein
VVVDHPMAPAFAERIAEMRASVANEDLTALVAAGGGMTPASVIAMVSA